jgi:hypothetical protein
MSLKNPRFLCRSRPRFPRLLKAALNTLVAEGRALDGPRDLIEQTTAQTGFYRHRDLEGADPSNKPAALTPATPPPVASSRTWTAPQRVGIGRSASFLLRGMTRLNLRPDQGSTLIYAAFVKDPYESDST